MMATDKQIDFILQLAGVRFLSQVPGLRWNGKLTKVVASAMIDELLATKKAEGK